MSSKYYWKIISASCRFDVMILSCPCVGLVFGGRHVAGQGGRPAHNDHDLVPEHWTSKILHIVYIFIINICIIIIIIITYDIKETFKLNFRFFVMPDMKFHHVFRIWDYIPLLVFLTVLGVKNYNSASMGSSIMCPKVNICWKKKKIWFNCPLNTLSGEYKQKTRKFHSTVPLP